MSEDQQIPLPIQSCSAKYRCSHSSQAASEWFFPLQGM